MSTWLSQSRSIVATMRTDRDNWDINTKNLSLRHSYPEIHAFDVIVNGNILIVTADNGLFQFDISSKDNITYLSKLADF